jgi:hypothetical protein
MLIKLESHRSVHMLDAHASRLSFVRPRQLRPQRYRPMYRDLIGDRRSVSVMCVLSTMCVCVCHLH